MRCLAVVALLVACKATLHGAHHDVDGGYRADVMAVPPDGGALTDATTDGTQALTASQLVAKYDNNACDGAFACKGSYPGSNNQFMTDWGASVNDCYVRSMQIDIPSVIDGDVTSGVIHFDPAKGQTCIAGLGYDCGTYWQQGPSGQTACQAAIIGTVADNSSCRVDWECTSWTSYCDPATKRCTPG